HARAGAGRKAPVAARDVVDPGRDPLGPHRPARQGGRLRLRRGHLSREALQEEGPRRRGAVGPRARLAPQTARLQVAYAVRSARSPSPLRVASKASIVTFGSSFFNSASS